ncbi:MAG: hypothetical protein R3F29_12820 [Planctomycetota bacterium]
MNLPFRAPVAALLLSAAATAQLHVPGQYPTIQSAIYAAQPGAEILVAPGTYVITDAINTLGKALTLRADGQVILDGMGVARIFQFNNLETPNTVIQGFVIQNGHGGNGGYGGVLHGTGGGAVLILSASPMFIDCEFRNCVGGDGHVGGTSSMTGDGATGGRGGDGGAVYSSQGDPLFYRCRFLSNRGGRGGDGGSGDDGAGNGAAGRPGGDGGRGGHGGAVHVTGTSPVVTFVHCLFAENTAGAGGQGGAAGDGADGGIIFGQWTGLGGNGGAGGSGGNGGNSTVYAYTGATLWFESCTFADNFPARGGTPGIGGVGGQGLLPGQPGAFGPQGAHGLETGIHGTATSAIDNSAFWNHVTAPGIAGQLPTVDLTGGIVANRCAGRAALPSNSAVLLVADPFDADYSPLLGSPLIDAADALLLPVNITLDLDRRERRFDHQAVPGVLDIGALEDRTGEYFSHGCTANAPGTIGTSGTPALGAPLQITVDAPSQFFPTPSIAVLAASVVGPIPGCSVMLPGFHMDPSLPGALLLQQPFVVAAALWTGTPTALPIVVPNNQQLLAEWLWLQGAMLDPSTGHIGLTGGLRVYLGE